MIHRLLLFKVLAGERSPPPTGEREGNAKIKVQAPTLEESIDKINQILAEKYQADFRIEMRRER